MTTEVVILNRNAVSIAADSAVTVGREKVWKSANKIFSMGPLNDIAIVIHNSSEFIGYPWESLIKTYREKCGIKKFSTVRELSDDFFDYLSRNQYPVSFKEEMSVAIIFVERIEIIKNNLRYSSKLEFRSKIMKDISKRISELGERQICTDGITFESFSEKYGDMIDNFSREILNVHLTSSILKAIKNYLFEFVCRARRSSYFTGIVFAGFGSEQLLPCVLSYVVDGRFCEKNRYWIEDESDLNSSKIGAAIMPFGQSDMISLFLEGIESTYKKFLRTTIKGVLAKKSQYIIRSITDPDQRTVESVLQDRENKAILEKMVEGFAEFRKESYIDPVLDVLESLPKDEMAAMAEALVEITSLRRKISSSDQSVGGPTDVIIISKGDGVIWIKRKKYFDIDLNRDYLYRKTRATGGWANGQPDNGEQARDV